MLKMMYRFSGKAQPNFVALEKFKDQGMLVYQSKEQFFYIIMSGVLSTYSLYHGYHYYTSRDTEYTDWTALSMCAFKGSLFLLLQKKIRHSARRIWLEKSGTSACVEYYGVCGIPGRVKYIENKAFQKSTFFLHKSLSIPVAYYRENGKLRKCFFQIGGATENETLARIFRGELFVVRNKDMHVNLSKQAQKNFKL